MAAWDSMLCSLGVIVANESGGDLIKEKSQQS